MNVFIDGVEYKPVIKEAPKTVMVELSREDAESYVEAYGDCVGKVHKYIASKIAEALKETK